MDSKPEFVEFPTYPSGTLKTVLLNLGQIATVTDDAGGNEIVISMSNGDSHKIDRESYLMLRAKIQVSPIAQQNR